MDEEKVFERLRAIYSGYDHNMIRTDDLPRALRKLADDIEKED